MRGRRINLRRGTVALLALLVSSQAWADPKDDARRHFVLGLQAASAKDYQGSLDEFLAAQAAYPHPATIYNIARAYTDLGDLAKAIEYYELYQDAAPDKASDVEPVLQVLNARLHRTQAPVVAEPAPAAGTATAGATSAELARLREIADELAGLSETLAQRAPQAVDSPEPTESGGTDASAPVPEPLPQTGELIQDAYQRVVVTASRYGQDPLDSPSTVTILTDQDIRLSGATNIPDLLRRVVGVEVMQLSAAQPDVSIRGFNRELSNKVLVLIDGRSVYLDLLGTVIWGTLPISMDEIERIEIIRGPGSAIYGANAVTGVINIITKTPGTGQNLVHVDGGTPGYLQGTALATGRSGATSYRFSTGYQQTGRWSAEMPVVDGGPVSGLLDNQDLSLETVRANGRLDRSFGDDVFASVSGGYAEGTSELYVFGALGDYAMPFRSGYARADLAWRGVHLRGFTNALSATAAPWAAYDGSRDMVGAVSSSTSDLELETLQEFDTGAVGHRLNMGLGYRYKAVQWDYLKDPQSFPEHHGSAFVQDEARVDRVSLVGSLRFDYHPLVPPANTISPRGAAIVRLAGRTSARVTGGSAFRSPTQMENYLDLNQLTEADAVFIRTLGSEDLLPERIYTVEAGLHDESSSWHRADVAAYFNRVDRLIFVTDVVREVSFYDPEDNGFSAGSTSFDNLDPYYDALGVELDLQVFPVDGLDFYANVDLQRIMETDASSGQAVSERDLSTSAVKANLGAMFRTPWRVDLSADYNFLSAQTWRLREHNSQGILEVHEEAIPARHIASARLAARPFSDGALELALTAWNIGSLVGDPMREHPKGQLVDGRLFGTVAYRF